MKVAIIYNKNVSKVINKFGMQNKEIYNPNTIKRVAKALEDGGHNVSIIDGDMHVIERIQDFMPQVMEGEKMGMVFNMAYGIQGESRYTHIPSMLEMLGIPYVGSSPTGHALALDKVVAKIILQKHNIPTPNFWVLSDQDFEVEEFDFPVIVKPKMESVSFGLKVVDNIPDLRKAVKYILDEFQQPALVEQFIPGREFAVGLLGNNPVDAFPVLEIDLENDPNGIQTFEDKTAKPKGKICPADLPAEKALEMINLSKEAFRVLQLRDFARVDFRMDKDGNVYILELNSMASLGPSGSYPFAANVAGYDYKALVNRMLDVSALRYFTNTPFESDAEKVYKKVSLDTKIRGFLRNRQSNIEKLLEEMVNINSFVRNVEGVNQLGALVKKNLSQLGFSHQAFPQVEVGNVHYFSNSESEEIDILLLGSLDTDIKRASHEYYFDSEQKLFGTGIWENKGGLTVLISALQSLKFTRLLKKFKIGILLTSDESLQGKFASGIVKNISNNAKYVLGLHGAFVDGGLVTSRSGAALYHCHANLIKNDDATLVSDAVSFLTKLVAAWVDLSDPDKGLVIAPRKFNIETNITDPYVNASVNLSVRFNELKQVDKLDSKIMKVIPKKYKKYIDLQLEGGLRRPSMIKTEKVDQLWKKIKNIAERLDIILREEHRWSSADICYVDERIFQIDGLGPAGAKPSNKSEYILRHSLLERAALLAIIITELNGEVAKK
ncbi:MAG: M20/M25/M40 family metallo-hydrolase [Melioribacteraceae bacterium]|nr:M20/M25/M40 family metallo-hydrolase [Melioribacteraceae bacterium]